MSKETSTFTYKVEDIFEDIPNDLENVLMNIPPEVSDKMGLVPGDVIKIEVGDQGTIIITKVENKENSGKEKQTED
jgi:frataxin-like iron-binding protein CyaY